MNRFLEFDDLIPRVRELMAGCSRGMPADDPDAAFAALALEVYRLQFANNPNYRALCQLRNATPEQVTHWHRIPRLPTAAFKEFELSCIPVGQRTTVFRSSGTTDVRPSQHFHHRDSLALYEASLQPWFLRHLVHENERLDLLVLTPPPEIAPNSSLAHMLGCVAKHFGVDRSAFLGILGADGGWQLQHELILDRLHKAARGNRPLLLLGTAFNFVHLLDYLASHSQSFQLAPGSRVMETGGYKGRSRTLPKEELHHLITQGLGIPLDHIVCEYGMCELSSQAYDKMVGADVRRLAPPDAPQPPDVGSYTQPTRVFHFPPWCRVRIISPETGAEVREGETGLICVYDLANAWSVMAIQTEDLGIRRGSGFELIGRKIDAEPRGCSLMSVEPQ